MKRLLLMMVMMGMAAGSHAAEPPVTSLDLELRNAHVWRGMTAVDGMVLQPGGTIGLGNFGVTIWGNIDLEDVDEVDDNGLFSEFDLTLFYIFEWNNLDWKVGYSEYFEEKVNGAARELNVGVSWWLLEQVRMAVVCFYEMNDVRDPYLQVRLVYEGYLGDDFEVATGVSMGIVGDDQALGGERGFNEYAIDLEVTRVADPAFEIGVNLGYVGTLDEDVLPEQAVDFHFGVFTRFFP
jgi:hypothetical protein